MTVSQTLLLFNNLESFEEYWSGILEDVEFVWSFSHDYLGTLPQDLLLDGHEFEQTPGDGEGQGSLACCSPWGCRAGHDFGAEQHHHLGITVFGWGGPQNKVTFPYYHSEGTCYQYDLPLLVWGYSTHAPTHLPQLTPWKEVTMCNPQWARTYNLLPWRCSVYINYLGSFCMRDLSMLVSYSIIYLYHGFVNIYLWVII